MATYYVANAGNDSYTAIQAQNQLTPWKTLSKLSSTSFSAGDIICLNKGDVWRESLTVSSSGSAGNYIKYTSYGTGNNPRILGSAKITTWTLYSGSIWRASSAAVGADYNIWFIAPDLTTIIPGIPKTSIVSCTEEFNYYDTGGYLYIYSPTDPNSRYDGVEVPARYTAVYLNDKSYLDFDGIDMLYTQAAGLHDNLSAVYNGLKLRNCEVAYSGILDTYYDNTPGYALHASYNDTLVEYCNIHHMGRRGVSIYNYSNSDCNNIVIQNNYFWFGSHVTGPDIAAGSMGALGDITNVTIRNNYFYEPIDRITSYTLFIGLYGNVQESSPNRAYGYLSNVNIYNNKFVYADGSAINPYQDTRELRIYNNTFYGCGTSNSGEQSMIKWDSVYSGNKSYIYNNIFYNTRTSGVTYSINYFLWAAMAGTSRIADVTIDYNLYYFLNSNYYLTVNPTSDWIYSQWASYKSSTGWDAHSPAPSNPLFVNPYTDLHLQVTSPAKYAGTATGQLSSQDYDNINWNTPPSIGAYEYANGTPPVDNSITIINAKINKWSVI